MSDSTDLTPSAKVIKKANQVLSTKDSTGRTIKYRKLKPSDILELVSIIGTDRSMNPIALSMSSAAYRVVDIDDYRIPAPESMHELREAMDMLGDEGLTAMYEVSRQESLPAKSEPVNPDAVTPEAETPKKK